jgi:hypothetical protein
MSNRARALILGVTLAAMNLAGMTAVAQAQANDTTTNPAASGRKQGNGTGITSRCGLHGSRPPRMPPSGGCWPGSGPPSQRAARPGARPGAAWRTQRAARLAGPCDRWAGCGPGAHRGAGRAGHQTGRPQRPGRARGLITVIRTPHSMGLPRPPAAHRLDDTRPLGVLGVSARAVSEGMTTVGGGAEAPDRRAERRHARVVGLERIGRPSASTEEHNGR